MRIVISNPDSIGDFVLRQPFYHALAAAGHELFLVIRSNVIPLAGLVAPGATVTELFSDPYSASFDPSVSDVQDIVAAARQFAPDMFCIAPYQWTAFDEYLAGALQPCRTAGMAGVLYPGDIDSGLDRRSTLQFDRTVAVPQDAHELLKNQRLCGMLLGRSVELPDPRIVPDPRQQQVAEARLQQLGILPGSYWIACIGHNVYTAVRNWSVESWARALQHAVDRFGRRFLLIGNEDERAATEEIRARMGAAGGNCENLCGLCGSLDLAIGLIHHSAAYLGHDTGPMHVAAALGKPVIAVFGGGTWPRFIPAAKKGVVLTVPLPCAGCDWRCHLPESYCVKRVPTSAVTQAIDSIEAGGVDGLNVQDLAPGSSLLARIGREGAASARAFRRITARRDREIQVLAAGNASATGEQGMMAEIQSLRAELGAERAAQSERLSESASDAARHAAEREELLKHVTEAQAETARHLAAADDLRCRLQAAEDARAEAVSASDKISLEMDSIHLVQVNLEAQLEACESERAAGRALLEKQEVQVREAAAETIRRNDEYQKLLEMMHGMTGEIASLSSQLVNSRRLQSQVERKCVDLQNTIDRSLALRLARSLDWALGPVLKLLAKSGVHTPTPPGE